MRRFFQLFFLCLFIFLPYFDLLRIDLSVPALIFNGSAVGLGIDAARSGIGTWGQVGMNIVFKLFLPIFTLGALFGYISWRWGRIYCGWLCPHFLAVEIMNRFCIFFIGKKSVWLSHMLPRTSDGKSYSKSRLRGFLFLPFAALLGVFFATGFLAWIQDPREVWNGLFSISLKGGHLIFICAGTCVFMMDFLLARHLFCKYGCAFGLFQSFIWICNPKALSIIFSKDRARECNACSTSTGSINPSCEASCPMNLKPRGAKSSMFACTQCGECVKSCEKVFGSAMKPLLRHTSNSNGEKKAKPLISSQMERERHDD